MGESFLIVPGGVGLLLTLLLAYRCLRAESRAYALPTLILAAVISIFIAQGVDPPGFTVYWFFVFMLPAALVLMAHAAAIHWLLAPSARNSAAPTNALSAARHVAWRLLLGGLVLVAVLAGLFALALFGGSGYPLPSAKLTIELRDPAVARAVETELQAFAEDHAMGTEEDVEESRQIRVTGYYDTRSRPRGFMYKVYRNSDTCWVLSFSDYRPDWQDSTLQQLAQLHTRLSGTGANVAVVEPPGLPRESRRGVSGYCSQ